MARGVKKSSCYDFLCLIELNHGHLRNKIVVAQLKPLTKPVLRHSRDINRCVREFKGYTKKAS